jgi:adenylate cyclase class IV
MLIVLRALWRLFFSYRPPTATGKTSGNAANGDKGTNFEVERKFRLKDDELDTFRGRLADMGFTLAQTIAMTDRFLPVKIEGEMLRVRDETIGATTHTVLTIKEWVEIAGGKERRESESHLSRSARSFMLFVGRLVRGKELLQFSKVRKEHESPSHPHVIITIDKVEGLGANSGYYAEIEVLVPQDGNVEAARSQIASLARQVFNDEREPVKASYMDMLKLVSPL